VNREYDLFERFPDGSSVWRASVVGLQGTRLHMRDLAQKSGNQVYAIEMASGKTVHYNFAGLDLLARQKTAKRSRPAFA
jgi:hypothetical protein